MKNLLFGFYDRHLASSLTIAKIKDSSEAEKLSAEGESVREDLENRKSYRNYLAVKNLGESEDRNDHPDLDEEEEGEIAAALPSTSMSCGTSAAWNGKQLPLRNVSTAMDLNTFDVTARYLKDLELRPRWLTA